MRKNVIIAVIIAFVVLAAGIAALMPSVILPAIRYQQAVSYIQDGNYTEAKIILEQLGDYRDAPAQLAGLVYSSAEQMRSSGKAGEAANVFASISYLDSDQKTIQCQADALFDEGRYAEAWELYASLSQNYHTHDEDYASMLSAAETQAQDGDIESSIAAYDALGTYGSADESAAALREKQEQERAAEEEQQKQEAEAAAKAEEEQRQLEEKALAEQQRTEQLQQAEDLHTAKNYEQARTLFLSLGETERAEQCQADALYSQGDWAGAWVLYSALPEEYQTHEDDYAALMTQAEDDAEKGNYDTAIAEFTQLGTYQNASDKIRPTRLAKAEALRLSGLYDEAKKLFTELGETEKVQQCLADELYSQGDYAGAWKIYSGLDETCHTHDTDYQTLMTYADMCMKEQAFAEAAALYKTLGSYGDAQEKQLAASEAYAEQLRLNGKYTDAEAAFTALNETTKAEQCFADALYDQGDLAEAWLIYSKLPEELQTHYDDYDTLMVKAEEDAENGNYDAAMAEFTQLGTYEDAADRIIPTKLAKAETLRLSGQYDEAEQLYTELGETDRLTQCSADQLYDQGDYAGAYEIYATLSADLQTHAEDYAAMMDRAGELVTLGLYDEARDMYRSLGSYSYASVMQNPVNYIEAQELRQSGDYEQAEAMFTALGDYHDSAAKVQQCRADALFAAGNMEDAAKVYETLDAVYRTHADEYSAQSAQNLAAAANSTGWMEFLQKTYSQGSLITFGHFEQDNNMENGAEPIQWRVEKLSGQWMLLVCDVGLCPMRYAAKSCTWQESEVRAWLNDYFLNTSLTEAEQALLLHVDPSTGEYASAADLVFVLQESSEARKPTAWAIACGATMDESGYGLAWLQKDADSNGKAAVLTQEAVEVAAAASQTDLVESTMISAVPVNQANVLVVPAVWVELTADAFEIIVPVK